MNPTDWDLGFSMSRGEITEGGAMPAQMLQGVASLALPDLLIEVDAA